MQLGELDIHMGNSEFWPLPPIKHKNHLLVNVKGRTMEFVEDNMGDCFDEPEVAKVSKIEYRKKC